MRSLLEPWVDAAHNTGQNPGSTCCTRTGAGRLIPRDGHTEAALRGGLFICALGVPLLGRAASFRIRFSNSFNALGAHRSEQPLSFSLRSDFSRALALINESYKPLVSTVKRPFAVCLSFNGTNHGGLVACAMTSASIQHSVNCSCLRARRKARLYTRLSHWFDFSEAAAEDDKP